MTAPACVLMHALVAIPFAGATAQETAAQAGKAPAVLERLGAIGWIDWTAISLLALFAILGLFKGFLWQMSRVVSLLAAWFLAGRYGPDGEAVLGRWFDPATSPRDLPLFLSYVTIFVAVVVLLSLLAMLVQKLLDKDKVLSLTDRLAGAALGLATGGLGVVVLFAGIYMFLPADTGIVAAAQSSRSMQYSQKALGMLGDKVPEPMRRVFGLRSVAPGDPAGKAPDKGSPAGSAPAKTPDKTPDKTPEQAPTKRLQPLDDPRGNGK